jgi:hypothetical protein
MERVTERGFMCCNVVMCAVVTGWESGSEMKRVTVRDFMCYNVVMYVVVMFG